MLCELGGLHDCHDKHPGTKVELGGPSASHVCVSSRNLTTTTSYNFNPSLTYILLGGGRDNILALFNFLKA
jgi:hypothetical protein